MIKHNWKTYLSWIAVSEAAGALSGWLSRKGQRIYPKIAAQASLAPPGWVFPVVWGILYILMGYGAARAYNAPEGRDRNWALNLFFAQLVVNFFWSLIFFNARAYGFAFFWLLLLWVLALAMILQFRRVDPPAAALQIPYLLWLTFAAWLNLGVWYLNR